MPYSEFKSQLAAGQVEEVVIGQRSIVGKLQNPQANRTSEPTPFNAVPAPDGDPKLIDELQNTNVTSDSGATTNSSLSMMEGQIALLQL
jgi:ATP-dependent Zn protease